MSEEYNKEIEKAAENAIQNPKLLEAVLKNYDELVKEKNNMNNLDLPYWCYGFGRADADSEKELLEIIANATKGKNGE